MTFIHNEHPQAQTLVPVPTLSKHIIYHSVVLWLVYYIMVAGTRTSYNLTKLEAEVHRIPRTLHVGFFVRTPFPTKILIEILTAQKKVRNAMKELLRRFYSWHTWSMSGTCFSSCTPRRIREKSKRFPVSIAISNRDIYRRKAECVMICHFSKLYMAIIIVSVEWTLWPLHIV